MSVKTAAGSKLYLGSEDPDESVDSQAEFEADSYQLVGEVEDLGEFGDAWNSTDFTALADSRVRRFKTTRDAGEMQVVLGFDAADAGQSALVTAVDSKNDYAFKLTLDDEGSGSPSNPTTFYFRAKVMSNRVVGGSNDNVIRRNVTLAINSAIIQIDAV